MTTHILLLRDNRLLTALVLLLTTISVNAGDRLLTLADVTGRQLMADGLAAVQPLADGRSFARISDDGRRIVRCSFADGSEQGALFDVGKVKDSPIEYIEDYQISPDGRRLLLQTAGNSIYRHSLTATFYVYDASANTLLPLSKGGQQQTPLWSPDSRSVAFVRDNNIFLASTDGQGGELQVTTDGKRNQIINGIPDWVNEEEFSTDRSMTFTADGTHLVWVRYDESAVQEYSMPLFKGLRPERSEYADYPGFYTYKYPIAGERNSVVTLWSYDVRNGQRRQLSLPLESDGYIPRIMPMADGQRVAVVTLNRRQDCMRVFLVNAGSGDCQQVIEEKTDKYVRETVYEDMQITSNHILLPSDRDGFMHLYLYRLDGTLERQIDSGSYEVAAVYGYDEKTGSAYYASHEPLPTERVGTAAADVAANALNRRLWVARKNGSRQCLTPRQGWSTGVFSRGFGYFIHTWSDIDTPPVVTLCDAKGHQLHTLVDNKALQQRLADYKIGERQLFTLTTTDGGTLNGWMVKPADFDSLRRYPVIMYQYGGPGNQQVANRWNIGMAGRGALLEQYLCQMGYVCVCVDNRGTGGRSADFEKCTYMQLGRLESRDQVDAALWLARQPWADGDRIAIWGWSFGGFNTLMAMSEGRQAFRCGIAIAPPTSWRYYDTIYTERFMRTPQENAAGYDDCPLSRAPRMHGALLLCHGMADDNVHFRNTAEYTEALVQADKDFSQLVYTNRNHSIYGGNTRRHLFRQCVSFFERELMGEKR
ncbi:MAG: S9 family peptidase [Prevotella sp.]|nr:S9 family peptidase [Prevotella sp.]